MIFNQAQRSFCSGVFYLGLPDCFHLNVKAEFSVAAPNWRMKMHKIASVLLLGFAFAISAISVSTSAPFMTAAQTMSTNVVPITDGCGKGRYRGPYGACHRFGTGPRPGGDFAGRHIGEGCGP